VAEFLVELNESLPETVAHTNAAFRKANLPALFRFKANRTVEALNAMMSRDNEVNQKFPVLTTFLRNESLIECISYLPHLINFQRYTHNFYNKRITLEEAQGTTIGQMLGKIASPNDRASWTQAFASFKRGWNKTAPLVERELSSGEDAVTFEHISLDVCFESLH